LANLPGGLRRKILLIITEEKKLKFDFYLKMFVHQKPGSGAGFGFTQKSGPDPDSMMNPNHCAWTSFVWLSCIWRRPTSVKSTYQQNLSNRERETRKRTNWYL
jgi:hypothetical protein